MQLTFHTLDVFTNRRFGGNPLAVVLDADHLSTEQMQTVTREFNLSETTFVMKPVDPANTAKVRIFFPTAETSFAGHPTLGTAILLAEMRNLTEIRFELKAGLTPVKIAKFGEQYSGVFTAPVVPFHVDIKIPSIEETAQALNLEIEDIGFDGHKIAVTEGGPRFFYVPVKSRSVLEKSRVCEPHWSALIAPLGHLDSAYIYTRGGDGQHADFRARMYSPTGGIPEDPATGSATALLAAQLLKAEALKDGTHKWQLEQGYEMGRPSDLFLEADVAGGALKAVRVAGQAVKVMQGTLEI